MSEIRECEEQKAYVKANKDLIRRKYGTDRIAVQHCEVVGHGKTTDELLESIRDTPIDDSFLLISTLDKILNPREEFMGGPKFE